MFVYPIYANGIINPPDLNYTIINTRTTPIPPSARHFWGTARSARGKSLPLGLYGGQGGGNSLCEDIAPAFQGGFVPQITLNGHFYFSLFFSFPVPFLFLSSPFSSPLPLPFLFLSSPFSSPFLSLFLSFSSPFRPQGESQKILKSFRAPARDCLRG